MAISPPTPDEAFLSLLYWGGICLIVISVPDLVLGVASRLVRRTPKLVEPSVSSIAVTRGIAASVLWVFIARSLWALIAW